jgi:hypothetical protein
MSAFEFDGYETLIAALRAGTLDAPDHLHRRVLAGAPAKQRRWSHASGRRRALVIVATAAVLAVGVAVVQSALTSSNSNSNLRASPDVTHGLGKLTGGTAAQGKVPPRRSVGAAGVTGAAGPTGVAGATGLTGPTGAAGANGSADAGGALFQGDQAAGTPEKTDHRAAAPSPYSLAIPTNRLVHASATLEVVVPNHSALTHATNDATQIVTRLGGFSQSVQYQFSRSGYGRSYLTLHVPLGKTQAAIDQLSALGNVAYQQISTQDLERQFAQQTSAIGNLRRQIAVYQQALRSGTLSGSQQLAVQLRLTNALHALKATRKARTHTVKSGHTADIQLTLTAKQHGHAAAGPHKTGRLGQMLHNIGQFLAVEGMVILYILIAALPLILVAALIWWLIRERRRREEKLLAASA